MEYRRINDEIVKKTKEEWAIIDKQEHPEREAQARIQELKVKLSKSDYMMLSDYQERTTRTVEELELVKQERLAWYTELKNLEMSCL